MPRQENCPTCGQVLPAGIKEHDLHEKLDQMRLATEQAATKAAEKEFEAQRKQFEADATKRAEAKANEDANRRVQQQVQQQLKLAVADVERRNKQANIAMEQTLAKALRDADDFKRQLKNADKNKKNELDNARSQGAQQGAESERKKHSVREQGLLKTIEELKRKAENKPAHQLGAEGEFDLIDQLERANKQKWHMDGLTPAKPGREEPDVTHIVRDANYRNPGKIIYEVKKTGKCDPKYIRQVLRYRAQYKPDLAVIVTYTPPSKDAQALCDKSHIIVLGPSAVEPVVSALREVALRMAEYRLVKDNADPKEKQAFAYIFGDNFKRGFLGTIAAVNRLIEEEKKDEEYHKRRWVAILGNHELIENWLLRFQADLNAIMGGQSIEIGSGERKLPGREIAGGNGRLFTAT